MTMGHETGEGSTRNRQAWVFFHHMCDTDVYDSINIESDTLLSGEVLFLLMAALWC